MKNRAARWYSPVFCVSKRRWRRFNSPVLAAVGAFGAGLTSRHHAHLGSQDAQTGKTETPDLPISDWTADLRQPSHNYQLPLRYVFVSVYEAGLGPATSDKTTVRTNERNRLLFVTAAEASSAPVTRFGPRVLHGMSSNGWLQTVRAHPLLRRWY